MYKDLLPLGSVVLLKNANKRLMIIGRVQVNAEDEIIYDYSACYYPEGVLSSDEIFFFNRDMIDRVYFIGFQDPTELDFREEVLGKLGALEIRNGEIVQISEDTIDENPEIETVDIQ